jgi:hypothetical protein
MSIGYKFAPRKENKYALCLQIQTLSNKRTNKVSKPTNRRISAKFFPTVT